MENRYWKSIGKMRMLVILLSFLTLASCTQYYHYFVKITQRPIDIVIVDSTSIPIGVKNEYLLVLKKDNPSIFTVLETFKTPGKIQSISVISIPGGDEYVAFVITESNDGNRFVKINIAYNDSDVKFTELFNNKTEAGKIIETEATIIDGRKTIYTIACQSVDMKKLLFYTLNGKLVRTRTFDGPVCIAPLEHWDSINPEDEYIAFDGKRVFAIGGYRDGMSVDLSSNRDINKSLFLLNESYYDEYRVEASNIMLYDGDTLWSLGLHGIGARWSKKVEGIKEGYNYFNKNIFPMADGIYEMKHESEELVKLCPGAGWKASAEIGTEFGPDLFVFSKQNRLDCDVVGFWVSSEKVERVNFSKVPGQVTSLFFHNTDLGKYNHRLDLIAFSDKGVYRTANKIIFPPNPNER